MTRRTCLAVTLFALATAAAVFAQAPSFPAPQAQNPVCARLEAQLTALDRGVNEASRLEQLKRLEEAANKQQFEIDRLNAQSARAGCEGSGFFLFGGQPPQCGSLNAQLQQMRFAHTKIPISDKMIAGTEAYSLPQILQRFVNPPDEDPAPADRG